VTDKDAFDKWLDEPMLKTMTRRDFARRCGVSLKDLYWAFSGGWVLGQQQAIKELE
jgi:hypothetical protein